MKTSKFLAIVIIVFIAGTSHAQVSVNVNIGSPPMWGPVGYSDVQYYYLPDVEAYYDVPSSRFIYYERGAWVHRTYLPARYRNYDLYGGYKVVMTDYRGKTPYMHFKDHKVKYAKGYRGHAQKNIGMRPAKGNTGHRYSHEGNHDNKQVGRGSGKSDAQGTNKNIKNDRGHDKGHGKKK